MTKTKVFFIATKTKKEPVHVQFYTKTGQLVDFNAVEKVKGKEGVNFYARTSKPKKR